MQFDDKFSTEGSANFVSFDFNHPERIPRELYGSFDFVVIDPPFITKEVWQQYADTAKLLMREESSRILLTTIGARPSVSINASLGGSKRVFCLLRAEENASMMQALLGCQPQPFKPSIPHLVYQYALFTNYPSQQLSAANPELE